MSMSRRRGLCDAVIPNGWRRFFTHLAEVLRHLGILVQPFVPDAAAALLDQLAVPADARSFAELEQSLPPGRAMPAPRGIFPRFVDSDAAAG